MCKKRNDCRNIMKEFVTFFMPIFSRNALVPNDDNDINPLNLADLGFCSSLFLKD